MSQLLLIIFITLLAYSLPGISSEDHEHEETVPLDNHKEDHEESSTNVGPDKGITEKGEQGFKLSPEAIKVMEIKMQAWADGSLSVDNKTMVLVKDEKSVFRLRDGWIKRVAVQVIRKTENSWLISSSELKEGDQIVNHGTGFLRIAEVFATEGASHGH